MINSKNDYLKEEQFSLNLTIEIIDVLKDFFYERNQKKIDLKVYNAVLFHVVNTIIENIVFRLDLDKVIHNNKLSSILLPRNLLDFQKQLENKNLETLISKKFYKKFSILQYFLFSKIVLKNIFSSKKMFISQESIYSKNKILEEVHFFKIEYRHEKEIKKILENKKNWLLKKNKKIQLAYGKRDYKMRKAFFNKFINLDKKKFFILSLFIELLPSMYFEMFFYNLSQVSKIYKSVPKLIISNAHNWFSSDDYKFYLSYCLLNGSKYIDTQINGSHFITKFSPHYKISQSFSDYFISWGFREKEKIINLPCLYTCSLTKIKKSDKKKKLLYVGASISGNFKGFWGSYLDGGQIKEYYKFKEKFFDTLNKDLKEKFLIRNRDTNKIASKHGKLFLKKNNFFKKLDPISSTLGNRILENDLQFIVVDHVSTPLFEIINSNIPFILILNEKYHFFSDDYNNLINEMIKEKILFYDAQEAANNLNKIDIKKINKLWKENYDIQRIRNELLNNFYNSNKNWLSIWKEEIERIY